MPPNSARAAAGLPSQPITTSADRVSAAARASARATFDSTRTSGSTGTSAPAACTPASASSRSATRDALSLVRPGRDDA